MPYETRINRHPLKTNIFCGRGFIRELKFLITGIEPKSMGKCEYRKFKIGIEEKYDLIECELDRNTNANRSKLTTDLTNYGDLKQISKSMYSSWWNGETLPSSKYRIVANQLFDGLADKWFSRVGYQHRFQLHLTALDLFELRHINPSDTIKQGKDFLKIISECWKPKKLRFTNRTDLFIWGPKERAGFDPLKENFIEECSRKIGKNEYVPDPRRFIQYNKKMGRNSRSYVGLELPDWLVQSYRPDSDLSIIPYLYLLLNLELDSDSNYLPDLILDFLTALVCGYLIVNYHKNRYLNPDYKSEEFLVFERESLKNYFFSEKKSLDDEIKILSIRRNTDMAILKEKYLFKYWKSGHPCFYLHYLIRDFFRVYGVNNFWEYTGIINKEESLRFDSMKLSEHMAICKFHTVQRHQHFRDLYYENFKFIGLAQNKIEKFLDKTIEAPPLDISWSRPKPRPRIEITPFDYGIDKHNNSHI